MCLSSTQPGGPRRCSGDTRAVYQRFAVAVAELERTCRHLEAAHVVRDATPAGPVSAAESQWAVCGARHQWTVVGEGHYGRVFISPDGTRAVKELLDGRSFGDHEVQLATAMGELGHSPRIFASGDRFIEMEVAAGAPLWAGYTRGETEPVMTSAQAGKAAAGICDLHRMGYAHGDLHALQFICSDDDVKLVDYGLAVAHDRQPVKVMHDLNKCRALVRWDNPELASIPFVGVVNDHLPQYRDVTGRSQAAIARREEIAKAYLKDLEEL